MPRKSIVFNTSSSGLGRPLAGQDHVSGLIAYGTLPAGFSTTDRIKLVFSTQEAEALGITPAASAKLHYNVSEFFRMQPKGELYVAVYAAQTAGFDEVATVQTFAEGRIRQFGVVGETNFAATQVSALQVQATLLDSTKMPAQIIYTAPTGALTLATLPDLTTLSSPDVSVVVGQDSASAFAALGTTLGTVALSRVNENIGWTGKFDVSSGEKFSKVSIVTGNALSSLAESALSALSAKGYIFLEKEVGASGTYFNDSWTATSSASDFSTIENGRTMKKVKRNCRTFLVPLLNSPLEVNENGTLAENSISTFELAVKNAIDQMVRDREVSNFSVAINPAQNVLSTSKIEISVRVQPYGVARNIMVGLAYAVRL